MKRFFFLLATLFAFSFTWTGCSDGGDDANGGTGNGTGNGGGNSSALSLSKNELEFDSNEGYQTIKVTSNGEWEVTGGSDWCDISPSEGDTGETVTISVEANTTDEDRTVTYTFKCGSQTAKLTVLQYGIIETSFVDLKIDDENTSVGYNEQTGETVIEYKSGTVPNAEIGQAFVLSGEHDYDIRKITSVTKSNGKLTLQTEQGNMCDLFKNVSFTLTTNPDLVATSRSAGRVITPTSIEIVKGDKRSVIFDKNAVTSRDVYENPIKIFDFNEDFSGTPLFENEDGILGDITWEKWETNIGLDAVFQFDFGERVSSNTKIGELKNFKYYLQGNVDVDLLLALDTEIEAFNYSVPEDKETVKKDVLPMVTVRFMAGPVPVVITLETDLKREGEISCGGSIYTSAGFSFNAEAKLGMEYDVRTREAQPITEFTPQFELHNPTFEIKASLEATAGYYPHLQFHFYKFLGPYLDIKPLYTAGIKTGYQYDYATNEEKLGWCADFGTKITGESGLELDWGLDEAEFELFEKDLKEATLFKAPASIKLESPEQGHQMEIGEEVEVCFHVQAQNYLTGDLYDCPGALVQFGFEEFIERSVANKDMAIADTEGKVKVKWKPLEDSDYLRAIISDPEGEVIDEAKFDPEIKDIRRTILEMIYQQAGGENWTNNENWLSDKPLHQWYGVETGYKDSLWISLSDNNLQGFINLSNIEGFDKSEYPKMLGLVVHDNQLTSINVSGHDIYDFSIYNNPLDSINISYCTSWNDIFALHLSEDESQGTCKYVNASGFTDLRDLYIDNQEVSTLLLDGCTALVTLSCENNPIENLDLSGLTALESVYYNEELKSLNLSGCTALRNLYCYHYQLTNLNVAGCTALESLYCENNQLTSLDVAGCTALESLYCENNQLTSLDVAGCTALGTLACSNNQLTSLNASGCTALIELYCYNNQLTSLDVTGCTALKYLDCRNNKISSVIPDWFSQLNNFYYDQRYTDYWWEYIYWDGHLIDKELRYTDNGTGWWYPGEPSKGYHGPY